MDKYNLSTQAACVDEFDNIWFFSNEYNALFCRNNVDEKISYITSFEEEIIFSGSIYTYAHYHNGKIIFIPCLAKNIAIYNTIEKSVHYIPIRSEEYLVYFNTVVLNEQELLLFPVQYSKYAYILNILKEEIVSKILLDFGEYEDEFIQVKEKDMFLGTAIKENIAYFAIINTTKYISLDLTTSNIKINELDYKIKGIFGRDNNILALLKDGNNILDFENNKVISLNTKVKEDIFNNGIKMGYTHMVYTDNKIIIMPVYGNDVIIVDQQKNINYISLDYAIYVVTGVQKQPFATAVSLKNKNICLMPYMSDLLVNIDYKNSAKFDRLEMSKEYGNDIFSYLKKCILNSSASLRL